MPGISEALITTVFIWPVTRYCEDSRFLYRTGCLHRGRPLNPDQIAYE